MHVHLFWHLTVIKQPTVRGNSSSCIRSYAFVVDGYLTSQGIWNSAKLANFGVFDDEVNESKSRISKILSLENLSFETTTSHCGWLTLDFLKTVSVLALR